MDKSPFLFFSSSSFHCGTRCAVGWVGARLFGWVVWSGAGRADMPFLLLPYCKTLNLDGILTTTFAFPRISRRISKKWGEKNLLTIMQSEGAVSTKNHLEIVDICRNLMEGPTQKVIGRSNMGNWRVFRRKRKCLEEEEQLKFNFFARRENVS